MSVDLRHSIYKRKGRKGWTLEYRDGGALVQRSYAKRTEAEAAWDDVKDERRRLVGLKTEVPTFRDYARRWLDGLRPHLRPSSITKYEWALEHLDTLAAYPLDNLDRETIRTLLGEKTAALSRSSSASIGSVLHVCLAEAVADGYLRTNPAVGGGSLRKRKASARTDVKAMNAIQLRAFMDAAGPWRDFFYVQWALGLRPGEAMALQAADIDFARRRVRVERTRRVEGGVGPTKADMGWVDLAPGAAEILRRRAAAGWLYLFPGQGGRPMGHATVEHAFKRIAARAGLPDHLTPHCLRHTFAAMQLQAGRSVYYVQRMLRHSSIQITVDTYGSWLDPGRPEHVAAMEADVFGSAANLPTAHRGQRSADERAPDGACLSNDPALVGAYTAAGEAPIDPPEDQHVSPVSVAEPNGAVQGVEP